MYEIGKQIKFVRELRGYSQKDFSKLIGEKNTTVSNWEKGLSRPNTTTLAVICKALGVSSDYLLGINYCTVPYSEATTFHERLKLLRDKSGKTQSSIANDIGISPQTLSLYFNNREPNYNVLCKIADYFNVTTDWLLCRDDRILSHIVEKEFATPMKIIIGEKEYDLIER